SLRRTPELDLVEQLDAVGLAAFRTQQLVVLAGGRYCRQRTEPRGDIALHLRRDGPGEPLVCAVRMLGLRMHHGGIGPTCGTFCGEDARDGLLRTLQRVHLER